MSPALAFESDFWGLTGPNVARVGVQERILGSDGRGGDAAVNR
jgi:hypothetical protein